MQSSRISIMGMIFTARCTLVQSAVFVIDSFFTFVFIVYHAFDVIFLPT